jgi:hypothetical protein
MFRKQLATPVCKQNEGNDSFLWSKLNDKPELLEQIRNNTATVFKIK